MHIYARRGTKRNARYERQTERIGFRQWHVTSALTRWQLRKRGPRVCHRRQETHVAVNKPIKMDRKRTPGALPVCSPPPPPPLSPPPPSSSPLLLQDDYRYHHDCITAATVRDWVKGEGGGRKRKGGPCNSQSIRRVETAALYRCLAHSALLRCWFRRELQLAGALYLVSKIRRNKIPPNQRVLARPRAAISFGFRIGGAGSATATRNFALAAAGKCRRAPPA